MVLEDLFSLHFFTRPPYFYLSIFVFTHPNDGWTGLYIKLCFRVSPYWNAVLSYETVGGIRQVKDTRTDYRCQCLH